ncbi:MAG: hemolytic protein HlpA-like protein [Gammaproteobacteria bacterium]|nr:hemolytic protein HlpA-like protein [Gammaproteobacteria bacterium]|tara:strand:+ start:1508 stop:2416 length:909 start_codon:yes stop_codon:yes gene_type:complete
MKIPVAVIIFNRPDNTSQLLESLKLYKPENLYVISDGPRKNFESDKEKVAKSRKIFEKIDWKCEVFYNNSDSNLGCRERIISGLNWVFNKEEKAIILEDDCIPSKEFFDFMESMLNRYQTNKKISSVCGTTFLSDWKGEENSYLYSKYCNVWGWATWKDRWQKIDFDLVNLDKVKKTKFLKDYLGSFRAYVYWHWILNKVNDKKIDSWAYIWNFTNFVNEKLSIIPETNLLSNIGIGEDSSHTKSLSYKYMPSNESKNKMTFPLKYPTNIILNTKYDLTVENTVFSKSIFNRLKWIKRKILG